MTRKASGVPKEKPPTPLIIAEHLPRDPTDLYNHVGAGWTAMKADTAHFPSLPETTAMDTALANLGTALKAVPNGSPTDTAAVKAAATVVRELWGLNARYAQTVLRTLPVEQVPPFLRRGAQTQRMARVSAGSSAVSLFGHGTLRHSNALEDRPRWQQGGNERPGSPRLAARRGFGAGSAGPAREPVALGGLATRRLRAGHGPRPCGRRVALVTLGGWR